MPGTGEAGGHQAAADGCHQVVGDHQVAGSCQGAVFLAAASLHHQLRFEQPDNVMFLDVTAQSV